MAHQLYSSLELFGPASNFLPRKTFDASFTIDAVLCIPWPWKTTARTYRSARYLFTRWSIPSAAEPTYLHESLTGCPQTKAFSSRVLSPKLSPWHQQHLPRPHSKFGSPHQSARYQANLSCPLADLLIFDFHPPWPPDCLWSRRRIPTPFDAFIHQSSPASDHPEPAQIQSRERARTSSNGYPTEVINLDRQTLDKQARPAHWRRPSDPEAQWYASTGRRRTWNLSANCDDCPTVAREGSSLPTAQQGATSPDRTHAQKVRFAQWNHLCPEVL